MKSAILFFTLLFTIILLFLFVNMYLKKQIDNFGIYCGRYNLKGNSGKVSCLADSNCQWVTNIDPSNNIETSWCTDAPPSSENDTPILSEYLGIREELS